MAVISQMLDLVSSGLLRNDEPLTLLAAPTFGWLGTFASRSSLAGRADRGRYFESGRLSVTPAMPSFRALTRNPANSAQSAVPTPGLALPSFGSRVGSAGLPARGTRVFEVCEAKDGGVGW